MDMSPEIQNDLQKLRDCISVLFMFVRQPLQDESFVEHLNQWLEQLVSMRLKTGTETELEQWNCRLVVGVGKHILLDRTSFSGRKWCSHCHFVCKVHCIREYEMLYL